MDHGNSYIIHVGPLYGLFCKVTGGFQMTYLYWFVILLLFLFCVSCDKVHSPLSTEPIENIIITAADYEPIDRKDFYDIRWYCEIGHGYTGAQGWTSFDFIEDGCARFTIKTGNEYTLLWFNYRGLRNIIKVTN